MKGLHIIRHSIQMILRNLLDILRLGLIPVAVVVGSVAALFALVFATASEQGPGAGATLLFIAVFLIAVACSLWFIVNWHRFVLLEDYPKGWIPPFHGDRMASYVGHALMLSLIMFLAMIPLFLSQLFLAQVGSVFVASGGVAIFFLVMSVLGMRLSVILPAAAIGKPLTLKDAFHVTKGANWTICVVMFLLAGCHFVVSILIGLLSAGQMAALALVLAVPVQLFLTILPVSILTTLYGHYVEGRPVHG